MKICSCRHQFGNHDEDGVCLVSNCRCTVFQAVEVACPPNFIKPASFEVTPDLILEQAIGTLKSRGVEYDGQGYAGGERSMEQTLAIFKALTGVELSLLDGWRFLICLKLARSTTGEPKLDTYIDLVGYAALAGEAALQPKDTP